METDVLKCLIAHYEQEFNKLDEQIEELNLKRRYTAEVLIWFKKEMNARRNENE